MDRLRALVLPLLLVLCGFAGQRPFLPGQSESDRALATAVRSALAEREGLGRVRVDVRDGVVHLSGEVVSPEARRAAEETASNVPGTRTVRSAIQEGWDLRERLRPTFERMRTRLIDFIALLPLLAIALLVVVLAWYVARAVASLGRPFRRISNPFLRDLVRQLVRVSVFVLGLLLALEIVDAIAMVGAVLGAAGVLSLVIGLAFRDLAENYLATVLLSLRQPFEPDDHIAVDGHEGRVMRLTSRATILMTLDGNHLHVPNATVFKGVIQNFTRNPLRRFVFSAPVGKEVDVAAAGAAAREALGEVRGVCVDPEPAVEVAALLVDRTELRLIGWVDQRAHDFDKVRSEAQRLAREKLGQSLADRPRARPAESDTSVDHDLDEQIAAERARANGDLLARGGKKE